MSNKIKENAGPAMHARITPLIRHRNIGGILIERPIRPLFFIRCHRRKMIVGGGASKETKQRQKMHVRREVGNFFLSKNNRHRGRNKYHRDFVGQRVGI